MANALADNELRKQLIALGYKSVGPITDTTRNLYVKKLDKLLAEKDKSAKSSDKSKVPGRSRGRASLGSAPVAPPPQTVTSRARSKLPDRKLFGFSSDDDSEKESNKRKSSGRTQRNTRSTRSSAGRPSWSTYDRPKFSAEPEAEEEEDEEEESEDDEIENSQPESHSSYPLTRPSLRRRSTPIWSSRLNDRSDTIDSKPDTRPKFTPLSQSRSTTQSRQTPLTKYIPRVNDREITQDDEEMEHGDEFSDSDLDEHLVDMTSKGINTSSFLDRSQFNSDYEKQKPRKSFATPSVSVFSNKTPNPTPSRPSGVSERQRKAEGNLTDDENILQQHFKTKEDRSKYKWTLYISKLLLVTVAVFFIVLALMYVNIKGFLPLFSLSPESREPQGVGDIVCHGKICDDRTKIRNALILRDVIFDHLSNIAGQCECGYISERSESFNDLKRYLLDKYRHDLDANGKNEDRKYSLNLTLDLIAQNPKWEILLYDKSMVETKNVADIAYLESRRADMSIICRLRKSFEKLMFYIFLLIFVAVVVVLGMAYYKYRAKRKEEEMKKVYELVERIIDILKQHHDHCQTRSDVSQESYMAVVHVRDMLIPVKQRRKLLPLWNKAVNFLAANESRIRTEMQTIKGEEFEVWRWLSPSVNGGKVWQGQAFGENHNTSFNLLPFTPTPCLKIRNMFDNDVECAPNWHVRIQDAILEKCGTSHNIVHIAVDRSSKEGCVYVKCGTPDAAGKAYRSLHGWWFDGNLVTVKFLRLERYHERFPGTANARTPLQPSNTDKLSLSQPYHRSVLELS